MEIHSEAAGSHDREDQESLDAQQDKVEITSIVQLVNVPEK